MKSMYQGSFALTLFALLLTLGCARQQGADRPATYPVTGTVTYKGEPVAGATVSFQMVDGNRSAVGTTNAQGQYSLTTFVADDGALPGDYKVSIVKFKTVAATAATGTGDDYVPPEANADAGAAQGPENLLPAKYADAANSGLTAKVTEGPQNQFDFALEE